MFPPPKEPPITKTANKAANILPNVNASELFCSFIENTGITNTFVGGRLTISAEIETPIITAGVFETLQGTWAADLLQHFDDLAVATNGRALRHLGFTPRSYSISGDLLIDGASDEEITLKIVKYDALLASESDVYTQTRVINNFLGGRNVAFFSIPAVVDLDSGDYIYLKASNDTTTTNITLDLDSVFTIKKR